MKILLVCALFAVSVISLTSAGCFRHKLHYETYKWAVNTVTPYCDYFGRKFGVGSKWTDLTDCNKCECTNVGLFCCGIGIYAGSIMSIPGCVVVADNCKAVRLNPTKTGPCKRP